MAARLKVMSYNVQGHAARFSAGYLDRIAAVIAAEQPDVVGLQEVHRGGGGGWGAGFVDQAADQAAELAARTGLAVRFGASFSRRGGEFGNAVLTAGEIQDAAVHPLPGGSEPRTLLQARVAVVGMGLDVYVTHFSAWGRLGRRARVLQATHLIERLTTAPAPFVLVGDLNAPPETPELRHLLSTALFRSCGELTCTHRLMRSCLDYVFADPGWQVSASRVVQAGPSDHWPVVVKALERIGAFGVAETVAAAQSTGGPTIAGP